MEDCLQHRQRFPGIEFLLPLFCETSTVLDYLADDTLVFFTSPTAIAESFALCRERIEANFAEASGARLPVLPPEQIFLPEGEWRDRLARFQQGRFYDFAHPDMEEGETLEIPCGNHVLLRQQLELQRKNQGMMPELARQLHAWLEAGDGGLFCLPDQAACGTHGGTAPPIRSAGCHNPAPVEEAASSGREIVLVDSPLAAGFDLPGARLHWVSESELFGELRLGAGKKKSGQRSRPPVSFAELTVGDIVVHTAHGLGRYEGLINIELGGIANDFFQLVYRDGDKLYVPVDQLKVISKYQGLTDTEPKLDKLGGKVWQTRREKVKEEVWKVAQDLLRPLCPAGHGGGACLFAAGRAVPRDGGVLPL